MVYLSNIERALSLCVLDLNAMNVDFRITRIKFLSECYKTQKENRMQSGICVQLNSTNQILECIC